MKAFRKLLALAAALCLMLSMLPFASAEIDQRFEGKSWEDVANEFLNRIRAYEMGQFAIGYYNTVTGEEHFINPDTYITVGSVYKVPLNMLYCERIGKGEMTLDSQVFGISYNTLLRGTIIDSNNDYAKVLWDNTGSYHTYRMLIAPYMGEDAETVDSTFYLNNLFTARQMITCLRTLYENPERFPYLVDVMKEAEPTNYFRRDERRYPIAHKYGYNNEAYHDYLADSGIIYTTDPFLLVIYTDNTPQAGDLLAQFTVLMCDYTEYNTGKRLKQGAADEALSRLALPQAPSAVPGGSVAVSSDAPVLSMDAEGFARLAAVLAGMLLLLGLFAKLGRRAGYVVLIPSAVVLVVGLLLCRSMLNAGGASIFATVKGDGSEEMETFFSALEEGEYAEAVGLLDGYTALGLETDPEDEDSARVLEALRGSFSHRLPGGHAEDTHAVQTVALTHLSYDSLRAALREQTAAALRRYETERSDAELYDEGYVFRDEVVQEAYREAFEAVLADPAACYVEDSIPVSLSYDIRGWRLQGDETLLNAVCGK